MKTLRNIIIVVALITTATLRLFATPAAVTDLIASTGPYSGTVMLTWTYLGPDTLPNGSTYYIQYSSWSEYQNISWSTSSAQVTISTHGVTTGSYQDFLLYGLGNGVTSYFKIWVSSASVTLNATE